MRTNQEAGCKTIEVAHGWKSKKVGHQRFLSTDSSFKLMPKE
jgi:hypothetical protein